MLAHAHIDARAHGRAMTDRSLGRYSALPTPSLDELSDHDRAVVDASHVLDSGGPAAALKAFLEASPPFEVDRRRERFLMSMNPGGLLRRTG